MDCDFPGHAAADHTEQEMAAEPWFSVRENDIFPEEFPSFLSLPEPARTRLFEGPRRPLSGRFLARGASQAQSGRDSGNLPLWSRTQTRAYRLRRSVW